MSPLLNAPSTVRSQYVAFIERENEVQRLALRVEQMEAAHRKNVRDQLNSECKNPIHVTLEAWMQAVERHNDAAFALRRERDAFVLALLDERDELITKLGKDAR